MRGFRYRGRRTREIRFPLGGIGTGCVSLDGTGHLVDWEIFNRPAKGTRNGFSHVAVKAEQAGRLLDARVLHGDAPPPYSGAGVGFFKGFGFGLSRLTLSGMPHFRRTRFTGGFPLAEILFQDECFPGDVTLRAFNPLIPLNAEDSSLPAAFFTVSIRNPGTVPLDYTVAFTLGNPLTGGTHNRLRHIPQGRVLQCTCGRPPDDLQYGDLAVGTDHAEGGGQALWYRGGWFDGLTVFWNDFAHSGTLPPRDDEALGENDHGTLCARFQVPPGASGSVRFVLSWNVPNRRNDWTPETDENRAWLEKPWRNYYATRFADAAATAGYALGNWERLERETVLFQETLFGSTLPKPVLDAVSANLSTLKTPTCLRLEDGSFYGWEGCHAEAGCCEGTCTHVWNYAYALPFLFPDLERSVRELDYRYNLRADGGMPFRLQLPPGSPPSAFRPCADGQFGNVLKVYREWKISGDTAWLQTLWPAVKQSIDYAWSPTNADRWDPGQTGVLWGRQHHTLDMELFGPNAWLSGLYLAALKAGSELAGVCGDPAAAGLYRDLFARGRRWVNEHLFNGAYFNQRIDLSDRGMLTHWQHDPKLLDTYWSAEHGELKYQIGDGCGIDQVLGQWHADLLGLGDIFDRRLTRRALQAVFRYNYQPVLRNVVNPCRLFGVDDEAGTLMFTWPGGRRQPVIPVPYARETMHGFEYQAASHMILNGMVEEGLSLVKAVRDRYDGEKRNPWNEIECGSHYARSMASYALLNAYSGFRFDGVRQTIGFAPVRFRNGRFRCFWALGTAWGDVRFQPGACIVRVLSGRLTLKGLRPAPPGVSTEGARCKGRMLVCRQDGDGLAFASPIHLAAGMTLRFRCCRPGRDCSIQDG